MSSYAIHPEHALMTDHDQLLVMHNWQTWQQVAATSTNTNFDFPVNG